MKNKITTLKMAAKNYNFVYFSVILTKPNIVMYLWVLKFLFGFSKSQYLHLGLSFKMSVKIADFYFSVTLNQTFLFPCTFVC